MRICLTIILILIALTLNKGEKVEVKYIKPKANFITAYQQLRRFEGNYVNDPDDFGGETYGGIARRFSPNWYGWRHVDARKNKVWNDSIPEAEFWVMDFYLTIWVREGFYRLENQEVANVLLDVRVHLYTKQAVKLINATYGTELKFGPEWIDSSLDTINVDALKEARKQFYLDLIKRKPHYKKYKTNWLRRADYV